MTEIIILGTIGLDDLKTPFGEEKGVLGGSAVYASASASFFSKAGMLAIKGEDLDESELDFLKTKKVSLDGVETKGKNFRWSGEYEYDMNEAKTLNTELNSLLDFNPKIPDSFKNAKYLFMANVDPEIQLQVIESFSNAQEIVIDTMNFWITEKKDKLLEAIKKSTILILNDGEARQLFDTPNLIKAGREALKLGLKAAIIKKGEHGSLLFTDGDIFSCPGYPLEIVKDPTGCGDCFGGSFIGYYSQTKDMRKAMVYGSVIASFNAEDFGTKRIKSLTMEEIESRYKEMEALRKF